MLQQETGAFRHEPWHPTDGASPGNAVQFRGTPKGFNRMPVFLFLPTSSLGDFGKLHPFFLVFPAFLDSSDLRVYWDPSGVSLGRAQARVLPECSLCLAKLKFEAPPPRSGPLFLHRCSWFSTFRLLVTVLLHKSLLRKIPDKSNPDDRCHPSQEYLPLERKRSFRGSRGQW